MLTRPRLVVAALAVIALSLPAQVPTAGVDDHWPQWRGPEGLGVAAGTKYAEEWTPEKNIAWKTPVEGRGHSSPVTWGNHLFLTTSIRGGPSGHNAPDHLGYNMQPGYRNPDSEEADHSYTLKVLAYDTRDGKLLWERTAYEGVMWDDRHRKNTYASNTVVTDGKLLYAFFEAPGIYAYDFDGRQVWKASLGNIAKGGMGPGTSPLLFENLVILQVDQEMGAGSAIVALDKRTGKQVWRTERTTRRTWGTPLIVRTPTRVELTATGAEMVAAYDPLYRERALARASRTSEPPDPQHCRGAWARVFLSRLPGQARSSGSSRT